MVLTESKMVSQADAGESPLQGDQQQKSNALPFSSLGRQSSIYSLTLDEFQHALCESGKSFGSMNMDEFLTSIWNAEENQLQATTATTATTTNSNNNNPNQGSNLAHMVSFGEASNEKAPGKQATLLRQGSLALPAPLCRKTVDEVWSEIHGTQPTQQGQGSGNDGNRDQVQNQEGAARQPTFGEMTLEDFLIKAGVVREKSALSPAIPPQQQHFGVFQSTPNPNVGPNYVTGPIMPMGGGGGGAAAAVAAAGGAPSPYQQMPPGGGLMGEPSVYANNGTRNGGYSQQPPPPPQAVPYGGRVANGGGYGPGQPMGVVQPVSPVSSDGICQGQVDNAANQYGIDMSGLRGRKRIIDGPVEKVVERRQRRMIKNRESAARSRARKQAYTVELEAELNQLKEENTHLKCALAEMERKRKQQYFDEFKMNVQTKAQKAKEKLRTIRRTMSSPF